MMKLEKANELFNGGLLNESLELVNELIIQNNKTVDALILRSKIFFKLQKWGECLNDLNNVLEIDEGNIFASNYKLMVVDIIRFWNKDSYNP